MERMKAHGEPMAEPRIANRARSGLSIEVEASDSMEHRRLGTEQEPRAHRPC